MNLTGPQDLRSDAAVNAPGLPFGSSVSHLELKRSATQKCQMSTGEENSKKKKKKSAFSRKRARRGATRKERKLVDNNCSVLVKHQRTGAPVTLTPAKAKWTPEFCPQEAKINKTLSGGMRGGKQGAGTTTRADAPLCTHCCM